MSKKKFETCSELVEKIEAYFEEVQNKTRIVTGSRGQVKTIYQPMSVVGLCNFLGISKTTLAKYEANPEYTEAFLLARQRIEQDIIDHAVTGEYNPVFSIFHLKNHFGWKDRSDAEKTANDLLTGILEGAVDHFVKDIKDAPESKEKKRKRETKQG